EAALVRHAAEHASGQLIAAWSPGEAHDPRRLAIQVQVLQATGAHACYNRRRLAWRPAKRQAFVDGDRPLASSMLALRAFAMAHGWTPALSSAPVATIDAPRLSLSLHGEGDAGAFKAAWPLARARFEAARCDAVIAELAKRLPLDLSLSASPGRAPRKARAAPVAPAGEIVVLTPVKNGRDHLPRYLELLSRLDAGGAPLSVAFLEGDSDDGTFQALEAARPSLEARFHRVEIHRRHEGLRLEAPRWAVGVQRRRRAAIARARNHLLAAALGQAAWALWLDIDLIDYPPDLLTRLIAVGRDIVVPHCVRPDGGSFDLNTFVLTDGADDPAYLRDGLFQPPAGVGRAYLEDIAGPGPVRVDSVGGAALLIRGDLHRQGLNFPAYSHGGYIETEGLAMMARDMGHACWALPDLRIVHPADPEAPRRGPPGRPLARPVETAIEVLEAVTREPTTPSSETPIFVCALGWRSGSTLVQRILMTDPSLAIWGEPLDRMGVISRVTDLVGVVRPDWPPAHHWHTHRASVDLARDWVANLSPDAGDFKAGLRAQMDAWLAAPARRRGFARWGVKEVRWSANEARVLRWLYPSGRFVLVVRDPQSAYASLSHLGLSPEGPGYWLRWPDRHLATLEDYGRFWNRMAVGWARAAGDLGAQVVRYEDLVAGRIDMVAVGSALGLGLRPEIALAARVGDDPHTAPIPPEDIARLAELTAEGRAAFGYGQ
ncbi:MAG: sulfotransferase, partial [Proteobacteria bacterium]|nr:sulfotransferase [Pseudomonadota bacterium]